MQARLSFRWQFLQIIAEHFFFPFMRSEAQKCVGGFVCLVCGAFVVVVAAEISCRSDRLTNAFNW